MSDDQHLEAVQDRKITWGLIAIVVIFVIAMSGIILWITTSLIHNELGGTGQPVSTTPLVSETPTGHKPTPTEALKESQVTSLVDATWTPVPKSKGPVKFLYWYVKPGRIAVGECVQITWETENAVSLQLYRNGELILDNAPTGQTFQDCPKQTGYAVYRLKAANSNGLSNWIELQVKVQLAP
jgi:hypothetical protein